MASSKLIALFFTFAMVATATVKPSEARVQGLDARAQQVLHPSTFQNAVGAVAPPPNPSTGSATPPAQLTECLTPLIAMMPCMDYLTNLTVLTPPGECCDGLKSVISDAPICLCHGMTGDMNSLMPRPIDPVRMIILPLVCGTMLPLQTLFSCNTQQVPPIMPPMQAPVPVPANPPASP